MKQARKYTSMVSHEMRTPIFYTIFFAQRVQTFIKSVKGFKAESAMRQVELILCTLHHLSSFVDDLLDFQQIKDGVFTLVPKPFDPSKMFEMVCNMFTPQSEGKQVQITWATICQKTMLLPQRLIGDERRLFQVLINLVKIALNFATRAGKI